MLNENVEKEELSLVILGSFNPVIITPHWLSGKGLIRESEADSADVRIIHQEVVDFSLDWISFDITQTKLVIKCTKSPFFEVARDLIVGILTILKETPITSYGFNFQSTIGLKTEERYYEIGNKLSPLSTWSSFLENPRLQRIDIVQKVSKDAKNGRVLITIFATEDLSIKYGVVINVNDHYDFNEKEKEKKFYAKHLIEHWDFASAISITILKELSNSLKL